ncbi:MAG: GatB/YqeY domain-containing protein [Gammaproteobacteria bacterium]|nr:GatB/YqeY domain-containing protein [Gammaproteobacteria bacterium]
MSDLRDRIEAATKDAMRARERERVKALRLVNAELKQAAIDGRKALADADVVGVLARMVKQRRDSQGQFETAGREDLAAIERFEIEVIEEFLPRALSASEIEDAVAAAIEGIGAVGMKDMGRVMGALKGELTGRADMGAVSQVVRAALQG